MTQALRIGILHPDLGIGGSERLILDAALQLQAAGHRVTLFTAHHDPARSFAETRTGAVGVRVHGDFFPSHIGGRLRAPCALVRMAYLSCVTPLRYGPFDVLLCDVVAQTLPILRALSAARLVFYCHFPDLLLTPPWRGWYQRYRAPLDRLESFAVAKADRILVNSQFTAKVFRQTFPQCSLTPEVLYPGVDCAVFAAAAREPQSMEDLLFVSINRYERKKNVVLALDALALLRAHLAPAVFATVRLVIAGGYDERRQDNRETFHFLQSRAHDLGLTQQVRFLQSISAAELQRLLAQCRAVVYTPEHEHFGYGPVEAMAAGRPVIAVNSGGPCETIRQGETGFLCDPTPESFAEALRRLIDDPVEAIRMGQVGRAHVARSFSLNAFGARLNQIINDVVNVTTSTPAATRSC